MVVVPMFVSPKSFVGFYGLSILVLSNEFFNLSFTSLFVVICSSFRVDMLVELLVSSAFLLSVVLSWFSLV